MKQNIRASYTNVRALKQDTKDIKGSVVRIESQMSHFNGGMINLANHVKVDNNLFILDATNFHGKV